MMIRWFIIWLIQFHQPLILSVSILGTICIRSRNPEKSREIMTLSNGEQGKEDQKAFSLDFFVYFYLNSFLLLLAKLCL